MQLFVPMLNDLAAIWFSFVGHVTWQASLIAVLLLALVERRPRWSSPVRYGLLLLALAKFALPPMLSLPTGLFSLAGPVIEAMPDASAVPRIGKGAPARGDSTTTVQSIAASPAAREATIESEWAIAGPLFASPVLEARAWLMLLHGIGALVVAIWIVRSYVVLRRLVRGATEIREGRLYARFFELSRQLGLSRLPRLLLTHELCSPAASGVLRPVVLLTEGAISLDPAALDAVLSHELAHHRRRDLWINWLQLALTAVWWFNPVLWLLNRQVRELREDCCDDLLLTRKLTSARAYCDTLLMAASDHTVPMSAAVALGLSDGLHPLGRRFQRIMDPSLRRASHLSFVGVLALALIAIVLLPGLQLSQAEPLPRRAKGVDSVVALDDRIDGKEGSEENRKQDVNDHEWPDLATVKGRVVDHQGKPVAHAEVLLLGRERIIMDADRRTWFIPEKDVPRPQSTRTNRDGNFAITRANGPADRLAVISSDPLLWVVPRGKLPKGDDVEIKLPASGKLAVRCELPGQPAKMPVMIELKTFDGASRRADFLRFHMSSFSLNNPGETRFEYLPPGTYAVQRYIETKTGPNSVLITGADRQLITIESAKLAKMRLERKSGETLTGQVRGLEDLDLRFARLTISGLGPEEDLGVDGKLSRMFVALDVIPIDSDGAFKIERVPPGKYFASLFAVLKSTPESSTQSADLSAEVTFTVPENEKPPSVELVAKRREKLAGE